MTTGGAISGYCAMGKVRIAARPAITIKIDSTAAKIGLSMKKREIIGRGYFAGAGWAAALASCGSGLPEFAGLDSPAAGGGFAGATWTVAPGAIFSTPSSTTRSPVLSPDSMIQPSPAQLPTC